MSPLEDIIRAEIADRGPMGLDRYMELCLAHPEHGYYMTRDPFGASGDFTTAPEISQMFGELAGLWLAQMWINIGSPEEFNLVELGPGRGTLMADILRVGQGVSGFSEAAQVKLIETSPKLREMQAITLGGAEVGWVNALDELSDAPMLLIANEFFDALPIKQFQKFGDMWLECKLKSSDDGFECGPARGDAPSGTPIVSDGTIIEACPTAIQITKQIASIISERDGAALIFDYGDVDGTGVTLQAVQNHSYVEPFKNPGQADLTAHVNFGDLGRAMEPCVGHLTTQGQFLAGMGIAERAETLCHASKDAGETIKSALHRLTDPDEMGTLFKAMAITRNGTTTPPGF